MVSPSEVSWCFGGTCCLCFQDQIASRACLLAVCFMLVFCLTYSSSWRWRKHVPRKHQLTFNGLHCVISQKTEVFIATAMWTSNPTVWYFLHYVTFDWCAIVIHIHRICSSSQDSHRLQHPGLLHLPIIRFSWSVTRIHIEEQSFSILLEIFVSIFFLWIDIWVLSVAHSFSMFFLVPPMILYKICYWLNL
jgi:hypothetical protein